jgi:hypothetical protein
LHGARSEGGRVSVVIPNRLSDKAPLNKIKQARLVLGNIRVFTGRSRIF